MTPGKTSLYYLYRCGSTNPAIFSFKTRFSIAAALDKSQRWLYSELSEEGKAQEEPRSRGAGSQRWKGNGYQVFQRPAFQVGQVGRSREPWASSQETERQERQLIMKCALYGRVSTRDKGQDTENQFAQLRRYAESMGWEIVAEFVDHESGGKSDREEFQQMFKAASQRKIDLLLFWSLDRLSREGVLPTLQYLNRLTSYGVAWRSFTEQYLDSTGIFRDAVIGILAAVARQEKIRISERTKAGLEQARAKGKTLGRPKNNLTPLEIQSLLNAGDDRKQIARKNNCSLATISRILKTAVTVTA